MERHGDGLAGRAKDGEGDAVALGAVAVVRLVRRAAWKRGSRRGACARHDALRRERDPAVACRGQHFGRVPRRSTD